ncbi:CYTH and CHAD domain-containing protein [Jatrophihabitans sp. DSM 45814]
MADTQREIESKLDVAPDFQVGDLSVLTEVGGWFEVADDDMVSCYYDTADLDLLRARLTLRRRTGTIDNGWHLKTPGPGFRTELRWPLSPRTNDGRYSTSAKASSELPAELKRLIAPFTHGNDVSPIVELKVQRTRYRLNNAAGELQLEIADDQVRANGLSVPITMRRWREIEVELGPEGTPADLTRATDVLINAGAFGSRSPSKLARALYGQPELKLPDASAGSVVLDYLNAQFDAITAGHFAISLMPFDPEAVNEPHEAVHQTRVATRRLRAALRIFAVLFDSQRASRLEGELRWFANELGAVRDREVLRVRLARAVEDLPAFLVVGPVAEQIDEVLLAELHMHADLVLAMMRSPRYHDLLDELGQWRTDPPFTVVANQPAAILGDLVGSAERTLAKRLKRASAKQATDTELHSARKAGKRARYAAEAAAPVLGKSANRLAKAASTLQTMLGEHQDAVVATELLRRIADEVADHGANAFTYGILVADQRRAAAESAQAARAITKD